MKSEFAVVLAVFGFALTIFLSCADNPDLGEYPSIDYFFPSSSSETMQPSSSSFAPSSNSNISSSSVNISSSSGNLSSSSSVFSYSSLASSSSVNISSSSGNLSSSSSVFSYSSLASSSSVLLSSSSAMPSSSSCTAANNNSTQYCSNGTIKEYGILTDNRNSETKRYKTVVIGTQTWMAENLNHNVTGSKCGNGNTLNDANTTSCDTYGRLYNWAIAMTLSSDCNSSSCSSKISARYQGVCPPGWHIPSDTEWGDLMQFINPNCSPTGNCDSAGTKLKSTSGWNNSGNGTDNYGFTALPGGWGDESNYLRDVGVEGGWWSTNESNNSDAYYRIISYDLKYTRQGNYKKSTWRSVRCLQD
jgi:uncharacterized protein (TIGR02145 family)